MKTRTVNAVRSKSVRSLRARHKSRSAVGRVRKAVARRTPAAAASGRVPGAPQLHAATVHRKSVKSFRRESIQARYGKSRR